jgi:threonine dehydratase
MSPLSLHDVYRARRNLQDKVLRTPLVHSPHLSALVDAPVYLKLESQQTTGSFKLRGATNAVAHLGAEEMRRGVVAASTGNHGRAIAYAARERGMRAVICMSRLVPANKVDAIRALGAEVCIIGNSQDDAQVEAQRLVDQEGLVMLPPFDHPHVIAGQATIGLEILEQLPDVKTVLVPLSGGGLYAGVALALKTANRAIKTIGVTMENGCAMHASLNAGMPIFVEEVETLADSLGGGIGLDNRYTFPMVRELSDHTLLISEEWIARGIRHAYREEREIIEGAGAVGIAAVLSGRIDRSLASGPIVLVVSGRNIDMTLHHKLVSDSTISS